MVVIHCPYHSDTLPDVSDTLPRHLSALPPPPNSKSTRLLVSIVQSSEGVRSLTLTFFLPLLSHILSHTLVLLCLLLVSIVRSREDALSLLTL